MQVRNHDSPFLLNRSFTHRATSKFLQNPLLILILMRIIACILVCLLSMLSLYSQKNPAEGNTGKISGRVADSATAQPIEYASISIFLDKSLKPVNGTTSSPKGLFVLDNLAPGTYRLLIEFIGYKTSEKLNITVGQKTNTNLGTIHLSSSASTLAGVTVTAQNRLIENKIDRMIYNAEKDITSQGGVATDVLKKIPMVSVDVDGNVELQGNSNIRFLINGKPSSIFGNNLSDALQSIPASQIKSIEVVTSPGAKYDAEGTAGIINIILKDSRIQGINGSINLSGGTRLENGSFNLNARKNNFGVHANISGNAQLPSTTLNNLNRTSFDSTGKTTSTLIQDGQSRFLRNGLEGSLGFDWNLNKKNTISGEIGYDNFGNTNNSIVNQQLTSFDSLQMPSDVFSVIHAENHFRGQSLDWNLNYRKTFSKEGQELTVMYQSSFGHNKTLFQQYQDNSKGDSVFAGTNSDNRGQDHETSIQADYSQPLSGKFTFETGAKLDIRNISSNTDVYTLDAKTSLYNTDTSQSNALTYIRHISAGYVSASFSIGKILDVKSGLRYEYTETQANYSKAGETAIPSYSTWAPSIIFSHHLTEDQIIKISYTRRIQRPGFRALNPFVNTSDPKNITQGNPLLKPEIGDAFELGYSRSFGNNGAINFVLFYRRSSQDIQPYIVFYPEYKVGDSIYTNVSVNTPENIGTENNYGANIYGSVPFSEKLTARTNLAFFYRYIQNGIDAGNNISSFNYRINLNLTYQFGKNLVAEFFGNFNSPRNEVQGRFPSFTTYNIAVRKQVWNKKGSFGLTMTNPFNKYVDQKTEVTGIGFNLNSERQLPFRSFGISFMYKFGKLQFKKEKQDNGGGNNPDEGN
jgi:ferric enterobactin receptor